MWSIFLLVTWLAYIWVVTSADWWRYIGVAFPDDHYVDPGHRHFKDLYAILSAIDCDRIGYNVFKENPCDLLGDTGIHVYGSAWLWLGKLGLSTHDTDWLAVTVISIFLLTAVSVLKPKGFGEFLFGTMLVASPAVSSWSGTRKQ